MYREIRLDSYIKQAMAGDSEAAFYVAKVMAVTNSGNDFLVQKYLRMSADLGNELARRFLAIYGLCKRLTTNSSTYSDIHYNDNREEGFNWLKTAACMGDSVATYLIGCCYQKGLCVEQNEIKAQSYIEQVIDDISDDTILESILLIELIKSINERKIGQALAMEVPLNTASAAN